MYCCKTKYFFPRILNLFKNLTPSLLFLKRKPINITSPRYQKPFEICINVMFFVDNSGLTKTGDGAITLNVIWPTASWPSYPVLRHTSAYVPWSSDGGTSFTTLPLYFSLPENGIAFPSLLYSKKLAVEGFMYLLYSNVISVGLEG